MRFSIIIPTYNRRDILAKTIQSALDQDFDGAFEIIVVDDGGTDDTASLIEQFESKAIRYYLKENEERGAARNAGVKLALGEYVTFLDSDDLFYPSHLSAADLLLGDSPPILWLPYEEVDASGATRRKFESSPKEPMHRLVHEGNFMSCHGVFLRQDVAADYPFRTVRALAGTEDWDLWLRLGARFPIRQGSSVSHALVHHEQRSVFNFEPEPLRARFDLLLESLCSDEVFMAAHGHELNLIRSESESYIALHGVMSEGFPMSKAFKHFWKSIKWAPQRLFRRRTLGFLKQLVQRLKRGKN